MQFDTANAAIGRKVAALRTDAGLLQAQLADRLSEKLGKKIDPTTITRLERGQRPVTVVELLALGDIFAVPATTLMPERGIIEQELSNWLYRTEVLSHQKDEIETSLNQVTADIENSTYISAAFVALRDYQQTGDTTQVYAALDTLGSYAETLTERTPLAERIDYPAILRDLGFDPTLIERALTEAEDPDTDGFVQYTRAARTVARELGFDYQPLPDDQDQP